MSIAINELIVVNIINSVVRISLLCLWRLPVADQAIFISGGLLTAYEKARSRHTLVILCIANQKNLTQEGVRPHPLNPYLIVGKIVRFFVNWYLNEYFAIKVAKYQVIHFFELSL